MGKSKKVKKIPRKPTEYARKSQVIRISPELDKQLKELSHTNESYDNIIRRVLGLPVTKYDEYVSETLYVIDDGTHLFSEEAVALGEAIRLAVKQKKKPAPIRKVRTAC